MIDDVIAFAFYLVALAVGYGVAELVRRSAVQRTELRMRTKAEDIVWDEFNAQSQVVHSPSSRLLCELIEDRLSGREFDSKAAWEQFKRERAE